MAGNRRGAPAALLNKKTGNGARAVGVGLAAAGAAAWLARSRRDSRTLESSLERARQELRDAQVRFVRHGDGERRELERSLHDGAQQQLIALRINVELARELAGEDDALQARLVQLRDDLDRTIDSLRRLARDIYPAALARDGLTGALLLAVADSPATVVVRSELDGQRFPPEVETAAYYSCLAVLRTAEVAASDGERIAIDLRMSDDALAFAVTADGRTDGAAPGAGDTFAAIRDRLGAFGGTLAIDGDGGTTTVRGTLPLGAPLKSGVRPAVARPAARPPTGTAASP